jgi:hypothetical protein
MVIERRDIMGMFNTVVCKYELPDPDVQNYLFQTKNLFENVMDEYTITSSGTIIWNKKEYEETPEEERPNWGKPEWDGPAGKLFGCMRVKKQTNIEMDFTGSFNFYTYIIDEEIWKTIKEAVVMPDVEAEDELEGLFNRVINRVTEQVDDLIDNYDAFVWYEYEVEFVDGKLIRLDKTKRG